MDAPADAAPPPLRTHLLGPVRLLVGDTTIPDQVWSRRAARSLLLLLLVTPDHRLPRDRVLDLLWPNIAPGSADQALRKAVHLLRREIRRISGQAGTRRISRSASTSSGYGQASISGSTLERSRQRSRRPTPPP